MIYVSNTLSDHDFENGDSDYYISFNCKRNRWIRKKLKPKNRCREYEIG